VWDVYQAELVEFRHQIDTIRKEWMDNEGNIPHDVQHTLDKEIKEAEAHVDPAMLAFINMERQLKKP
jgi:hypothetical protein